MLRVGTWPQNWTPLDLNNLRCTRVYWESVAACTRSSQSEAPTPVPVFSQESILCSHCESTDNKIQRLNASKINGTVQSTCHFFYLCLWVDEKLETAFLCFFFIYTFIAKVFSIISFCNLMFTFSEFWDFCGWILRQWWKWQKATASSCCHVCFC